MEVAYKSILERLVDKVGDLKYIDLDAGQIDDEENNYTIDYPACFIRFDDIPFETLGDNVQQGDAIINFRIAFHTVRHDVNSVTPEAIRNEGLNSLALLKQIHKNLQAWYGENFNAMNRTGFNQESRNDGKLVFNMSYKTKLRDSSAVPERVKKTVTMSINLQNS